MAWFDKIFQYKPPEESKVNFLLNHLLIPYTEETIEERIKLINEYLHRNSDTLDNLFHNSLLRSRRDRLKAHLHLLKEWNGELIGYY